MQLKFTITGMTCAACSARVEKVTKDIEGVQKAEVNLLGGTMTVEAAEDGVAEKIIKAVTQAGYSAMPAGEKKALQPTAENGLKEMKKRIIGSGVFSPLFRLRSSIL